MTDSVTVTEASSAPVTRLDLGLMILRVIVGFVFVFHGYDKLFVSGIPGVTGFFTQVGAPLPDITAPLVSVLEFAGGIALILGFLTPVVAALLAVDVLSALFLVHLPNGFAAQNGPGAFAVSALFGRGRAR